MSPTQQYLFQLFAPPVAYWVARIGNWPFIYRMNGGAAATPKQKIVSNAIAWWYAGTAYCFATGVGLSGISLWALTPVAVWPVVVWLVARARIRRLSGVEPGRQGGNT